MVKCERCGRKVKSQEDIARWLNVLLTEVEELALLRMIDSERAAGNITTQEAESQRASVQLPYLRIHLKQLIEGIEVCPHSGPAGSESGGRPPV